MPEASPADRAATLITVAEQNTLRLGGEERQLIMAYAEVVDDTGKTIGLINRLCEQDHEMQHSHMDDFMKSQTESEIAVERAEQTTTYDPAVESIVTILWSKNFHLKDDQQTPLYEAKAVFGALDSSECLEREQPNHAGSWCGKTKSRIDFTM